MSKKFGRNQKRKLKSEIVNLQNNLIHCERGAHDLHRQYNRRWNSLQSIAEEVARLVNNKDGDNIMLISNNTTFDMFLNELRRLGLVTKSQPGTIWVGKIRYIRIYTGPSFEMGLQGTRWARAVTTIGMDFTRNDYVKSAVLAHLREDQTIREINV